MYMNIYTSLQKFSNANIIFIPKLNPFLLLSRLCVVLSQFLYFLDTHCMQCIRLAVFLQLFFFGFEKVLYVNVYYTWFVYFVLVLQQNGLNNQMHLFGLYETLFSATLPFFSVYTCAFYRLSVMFNFNCSVYRNFLILPPPAMLVLLYSIWRSCRYINKFL